MYRIAVDSTQHRVDIDFIDSYADVDEEALSRDLRQGALRARGNGDYFDLLVDFTRAPIIPQNMTTSARARIEWCVANGLRRSANILSSALAKMQVQRLSADERFQVFSSRDEALDWLRS